MSFVVPLLLDLVHSFKADQTKCRKVQLVWAVRTNGTLLRQPYICLPVLIYGLDGISWFHDAISTAMKTAPEQLSIDVSYYVTDTTTTIDDDASVQSEKSRLRGGGVSRNTGRPRLHAVVKEFCAEKGTVAIASTSSCYFLYRPGVADAIVSRSLRP